MVNSTVVPHLISWNITKQCNLKCAHCYLDADESKTDNELSTEQGFRLIDQIAELNPYTMLILTGGEPLLRKDVLDLAKYAFNKNLMVVIGTNGILLTEELAKQIKEHKIKGIGISLDSLNPQTNDSFRGISGACDKAKQAIQICKKIGLEFQIQTTVTKNNYDEIPDLIQYSNTLGAKAFTLFFLVCTGRGQNISDITAFQYEEMLFYLVKIQEEYKNMMIRARCAPHFIRILYQQKSSVLNMPEKGCMAGTNYCRITPSGDVTPCPYLPIKVGNVKEENFVDVWNNAKVFNELRKEILRGRCGSCEFSLVCGGCRARAYAFSGNYLDEDPWCKYEPKGGEKILSKNKTMNIDSLKWTEEAEKRMENIPFFLRKMIRKMVENYAKEKGYSEITPQIMKEVKNHSNFKMSRS